MEDWFRKTEGELYNYPLIKVRLQSLEFALETALPKYSHPLNENPGGSSKGTPGDPLSNLVSLRLSLEKKIEETRKKIHIIDEYISTLNGQEKELFTLKYQQEETAGLICHRMSISRSTYRRIREALVIKAAVCLDYIDPDEVLAWACQE